MDGLDEAGAVGVCTGSGDFLGTESVGTVGVCTGGGVVTVGTVTFGTVTVGTVTLGTVTVGTDTVGTLTVVGTVTFGTDSEGTDTDGIDGIVPALPSRGSAPPTISASRNPAMAANQPRPRSPPARDSCRARTDRRPHLMVGNTYPFVVKPNPSGSETASPR